jgi:uncharacterized Ntn-hydrolase superfamily protein
VNTFSIVARDHANGDLGVAVESKFLAVGAVVPWARAGVGAIATQAHTATSMGPAGLALLAGGASAQAALDQLLHDDPTPAARQVGVVDATGRAATYTGPDATFWAGGVTGDGFCCQGNILTGPEVVDAMVEGYTTASGTFAHRLLTALEAGQAAGGDSRGQQSAAILIVREGGGYGGGNDRLIDLRVDDHPTPIAELRRLVLLHRVYFDLDEADLVPFDDLRLAYVASRLSQLGYLPNADAPRAEVVAALRQWAGRENLEERLRADDQLDSVVLEWLARDA